MEPKLIRVGRGERDKENRINDIQVNHPSVSRSHLEIFIDPENNIFVTDLQTRNGTFVNGNPVVGTILLREGDILKLGSAKPVQWKKWIAGDFRDSDEQTNPAHPVSIPSEKHDRLMMTTAGQSKKPSGRRMLWIWLLLLFLLIIGALVWKINQTPAQQNNAGDITTVYTRFDLELKEYVDLQQLLLQKPKVSSLSTGDILITADNKSVSLTIENNILTGMQLLEVSKKPSVPDSTAAVAVSQKTDSSKDNTIKKDDKDNDGVKDEDDFCVNLPGTTNNNGCPTGYYESKDYKNGYYEVKVLMGGESIRQFRDRVSKIPTLNCSNPSEEADLIMLNENSLNEDNKKYGTLPGGYWIIFKCN